MTSMPAWSVAVHSLRALGGSGKDDGLLAGGSAALLRARELGLCRRWRGTWKITALGLAWCDNRVRIVHGGQCVHFVPTWFGGVHLLRQAPPVAVAVMIDPIRKGQLYRLPSGRYVMVTGLNGSNIACVYLPQGERPERVGLRRDFVVKDAKRVLWANSSETDRGSGS